MGGGYFENSFRRIKKSISQVIYTLISPVFQIFEQGALKFEDYEKSISQVVYTFHWCFKYLDVNGGGMTLKNSFRKIKKYITLMLISHPAFYSVFLSFYLFLSYFHPYFFYRRVGEWLWRFISKIMKINQSSNLHTHFPGYFTYWNVNGEGALKIHFENYKEQSIK